MANSRGIAIVGLGARFPGAEDVEQFWRNIAAGHDAIGPVPEERIPGVFFDASTSSIDRLPCRRGGFLGASINLDVAAHGLMPVAARGAEPDQLLALDLATATFADAGYTEGGFDRSRTAVILGRGGYLGPGLVRADQSVRGAEQLAGLLRRLLPDLPLSRIEAIKDAYQEAAGPYGPDTAIGLVPNLAASRIANRLDLRGPAFTLDAACASSLLAVEQAMLLLETRRADHVLAGGIHLVQDPTFWSVFAQLGALSRSEAIRPFDARADGLLIGEGAGFFLLERLEDAEAAGHRIYAVIRGVGSASDGRGTSVMQPRAEGQRLALERAWEGSGLEPAHIGLVEGHGTGTTAGDGVELETLARFFGPAGEGPRASLGSVKSMIGHTMPAAGAAGLIKAALAIFHRSLPPSLHCEEPHPKLAATRFEVHVAARPWTTGPGEERVAAVNAFGFGGIDAHVVLSEAPAGSRRTHRVQALDRVEPSFPGLPDEERTGLPEVLRLAGDSPAALLAALERGEGPIGTGPCRLAVLQPTPERLARARRVVERGEPWRGRGGIWFAPEGLALQGGKVAFLFPGVDADFRPRVRELAEHFDLSLPPELEALEAEEAPRRPEAIDRTGMGIYRVNQLCFELLSRIGLFADAMAGHSIGEWSAMIHGGLLPQGAVEAFLEESGGQALEVPGVLFAAAACSVDDALDAMTDLEAIGLSHDNCPHQVILCGKEESIETARARLLSRGAVVQILPFRSGFHSRLFDDYLDPHRAHFERLPIEAAHTTVWSATTCSPFPVGADAVRELALRHLVEPVRFRELIEALYDHGHSIFVQVGTGSLPGFVSDTLGARPHLTVSVSDPKRGGLESLARLGAALFVEGIDLWAGIDRARRPGREAASGGGVETGSRGLELPLGAPFISVGEPLPFGSAGPRLPPPARGALRDPLRDEVEATLEDLSRMQAEILETYQQALRGRSRPVRQQRTLSVRTVPELIDHSFYPQGEGATLAERDPVVPMTMSIELLLELARKAFPGRTPVALEELRMHQWLRVHPAAKVQLVAEPRGDDRAHVAIEGFCEGTVRLADAYPAPPASQLPPLADAGPPPIDAATLYADRWMFHGPAYQGVHTIGALGAGGVEGKLKVTEGPGALLDSLGQLFGFWLMATRTEDKLAMPIGLESLERFGPHPQAGELLDARVRITHCDDRRLVGDMEVLRGEQVWCRIRGWADHRFPSDPDTWKVLQHPERHRLSARREPYFLFDAARCRPPSRDWLIRRMLSEHERTTLLASAPQAQRAYLHARIAGKDAVRSLLEQGAELADPGEAIFPSTLPLLGDHEEGLRLAGPHAGELKVDAATAGDLAVALASRKGEVAIALYPLGSLPPGARQASFASDELDAARAAGAGDDLDARLHVCAARAIASRLAARGGEAGPREADAVSEGRPGGLRVGELWVELRVDLGHLVAWALRPD
ncbi:MAG: beta-ketoacyl synthase N-terminal-like domain-containing protein [Deltaproteobacteria bacterium]|nr:beta-ketoacyl synthase N-terminal-like domain-containing protein [Deltaproteobacteria bacterium]